ncbi:hypothetical protein [Streptomyces sp. NBC_01022]|uniref:hypothetical protein n=1 Tax=Streptomyces sp. NBC_01022 TaxID=2903723 RepID=UPI002DDA69AF|nr:hypothetical protein [Streptomyces sp. NBC_01022]WRZ83512.1 hypothetical protein OG316_26305 [Streptomyces sp. NBC_01022]
MDQKSSPDLMPSWIPATGHALRHAGIHFDAVRIIGILGEQVAYEVMQFTDFQAGPIVRSRIGERSMYFLLPPGSARAYRWPVGAEALVREGANFVGVPAVHGLTYPLDWRSLPTPQVPFVDAELLFELLREVVDDEIPAVR